MKSILVLLALAALIFSSAQVTKAEDPEPWTYAAVGCSGLPHDLILTSVQRYTTAYGWVHHLPDGAIPGALFVWQAAHPAIVNGWLHLHNCPAALNDDGTALTFAFQLTVPVYVQDFTAP